MMQLHIHAKFKSDAAYQVVNNGQLAKQVTRYGIGKSGVSGLQGQISRTADAPFKGWPGDYKKPMVATKRVTRIAKASDLPAAAEGLKGPKLLRRRDPGFPYA